MVLLSEAEERCTGQDYEREFLCLRMGESEWGWKLGGINKIITVVQNAHVPGTALRT